MLYSLHVVINHLDTEREYTVEPKLSLGALEDAISTAIDENSKATSFLFSVVQHPAPKTPNLRSQRFQMDKDIGNLHVIDYYLHQGMLRPNMWKEWPWYRRGLEAPVDYDISTEQREGWAYESNSL